MTYLTLRALVTDFSQAKLAVHVTSDGVVYKKDVRAIASGSRPRYDFGRLSPRGSSEEAREEREIHQKYFSRKVTVEEDPVEAGKFQSVLILAPIKPGIDTSINPIYYKPLKVRVMPEELPIVKRDIMMKYHLGILSASTVRGHCRVGAY